MKFEKIKIQKRIIFNSKIFKITNKILLSLKK
jgi:hypothetical protein